MGKDFEDLGMDAALQKLKQKYRKPDTNCNDCIRMVIQVNGKLYSVVDKLVNTQGDMTAFKDIAEDAIQSLDLETLSKFGA